MFATEAQKAQKNGVSLEPSFAEDEYCAIKTQKAQKIGVALDSQSLAVNPISLPQKHKRHRKIGILRIL
ncbi:hypothetical protein ASG14_02545 [Pedobacter sp. Leaf194]|nr:hypothetical protein ASG14_02545 [Pedobacter sp. Leaf194]